MATDKPNPKTQGPALSPDEMEALMTITEADVDRVFATVARPNVRRFLLAESVP